MMSLPVILQLPSSYKMTDEQFFEFCQVNRDYRIERNKFGKISIMSPTGGKTGNRGGNIFGQLWVWAQNDGTGLTFDSSTGFILSTGAERSPDASWMKLERWNNFNDEQQEKFLPICPDFVVELRSASDNLKPLQEKMEEYMQEDEIKLGWLIDRKNRKVYIYRPGMSVECLNNLDTVSGESILPGFVLNMSLVW
ncbi:MAG: Uma2 family endonuclease [Calothrix sp. FI2-JRJ7]|nr:Uma2 family endonuclease [Calothrix sp. FI2-JRJ7]